MYCVCEQAFLRIYCAYKNEKSVIHMYCACLPGVACQPEGIACLPAWGVFCLPPRAKVDFLGLPSCIQNLMYFICLPRGVCVC